LKYQCRNCQNYTKAMRWRSTIAFNRENNGMGWTPREMGESRPSGSRNRLDYFVNSRTRLVSIKAYGRQTWARDWSLRITTVGVEGEGRLLNENYSRSEKWSRLRRCIVAWKRQRRSGSLVALSERQGCDSRILLIYGHNPLTCYTSAE